MQDNIRTAGHAFDVELPTGRMEQGKQLCRPSADVLMRLPSRLSDWLPSLAQVWDCLVTSGARGSAGSKKDGQVMSSNLPTHMGAD